MLRWSAHAHTVGVGLKAHPAEYVCASVVVQYTLQKFSDAKLELCVCCFGHFGCIPTHAPCEAYYPGPWSEPSALQYNKRMLGWSAHARTVGVGLKAKPWQYICAVVVVQNTLQKFSETKLELWVRFGGHFWLYPGTRQIIIIQNYGGKGSPLCDTVIVYTREGESLASYPGSRRGRRKESLVQTVCACV